MNEPRLLLMEAIARKLLVTARYNGATLRLAPHALFERHGELFASALNLDKNWLSEDVRRLGHFKLSGLSAVELSEESFDPLPGYEPGAPRPEDLLIFAV